MSIFIADVDRNFVFCLCNCYAVITNVERSSDFEVSGEEGNCRFVIENVERSFIFVVARYIEDNFYCLIADVEGYCGVVHVVSLTATPTNNSSTCNVDEDCGKDQCCLSPTGMYKCKRVGFALLA